MTIQETIYDTEPSPFLPDDRHIGNPLRVREIAMQYSSDRYGSPVSKLGYGCMRFSRKGGSIDFEKTERELLLAMEKGVNYFDTAYIYPGSEDCLGRVLEKNGCRGKISIATKLPQYMVRSREQIDKFFLEELRRLRTDRIDYYLMHMFTDYAEWENLVKCGIEDWINTRKAEGKIKNIGFSYHGGSADFIRLLNAYDWDFCQIQYNYLDEHTQAGLTGLEAAREKGVPVVIMEPLRGGKLVRLPSKALRVLESMETPRTPAELGLGWLYNQPGILCVLSGMNSVEMVEENCRIADEAGEGHFTEADFAAVEKIRSIFRENEKVGCTGCRYCMPCPRGVDIPGTFHYYNLMYMEKKLSARFECAQVMGLKKEPGFADKCIGCGKCESHCPQHLPIREKLKEADKALRPPLVKAGTALARRFLIH